MRWNGATQELQIDQSEANISFAEPTGHPSNGRPVHEGTYFLGRELLVPQPPGFGTSNHPGPFLLLALSLSIRVVATTAPPVALILGFVLVFSGIASNSQMMVQAGWVFVAVGVALQLAYLASRYVVTAWISAKSRASVRRTT